MKLTKNSNLLFVALALVLSLVSFTRVSNHTPKEAIKIALVVNDYSEDICFAISYQNAIKIDTNAFLSFSVFSFIELQKNYSLKVISTFKTYTYQTLGLSTEQQQTKFALSTHQTLYNSIPS